MPQFACNGQRMHGMQPSSGLEFLEPVPERGPLGPSTHADTPRSMAEVNG